MRLLWVVPEKSGGIQTYAEALWPAVREAAKKAGIETLEPLYGDLSIERIRALAPDLIHVQHEFGLFGSKIPGFNRLSKWMSELRAALPKTRIVATAHTVLHVDYRYPTEGRGWQIPFRAFSNAIARPWLVQSWTRGTWPLFDGVIVHSAHQSATVRDSGCKTVQVIPHFVPQATQASEPVGDPSVLVFGYFSPEKGQDLAIAAWRRGQISAKLVLAGGVRRNGDRSYFRRCKKAAEGLAIEFSGFVAPSELDATYARATIILAPFRETSGSGSLAHALARGACVLASDLPLNREIADRVPGAAEFFAAGNAEDLETRVLALLADSEKRERCRQAARQYAEKFSPTRIAEDHFAFYRR